MKIGPAAILYLARAGPLRVFTLQPGVSGCHAGRCRHRRGTAQACPAHRMNCWRIAGVPCHAAPSGTGGLAIRGPPQPGGPFGTLRWFHQTSPLPVGLQSGRSSDRSASGFRPACAGAFPDASNRWRRIPPDAAWKHAPCAALASMPPPITFSGRAAGLSTGFPQVFLFCPHFCG